jgi:hypothetical protein
LNGWDTGIAQHEVQKGDFATPDLGVQVCTEEADDLNEVSAVTMPRYRNKNKLHFSPQIDRPGDVKAGNFHSSFLNLKKLRTSCCIQLSESIKHPY